MQGETQRPHDQQSTLSGSKTRHVAWVYNFVTIEPSAGPLLLSAAAAPGAAACHIFGLSKLSVLYVARASLVRLPLLVNARHAPVSCSIIRRCGMSGMQPAHGRLWSVWRGWLHAKARCAAQSAALETGLAPQTACLPALCTTCDVWEVEQASQR